MTTDLSNRLKRYSKKAIADALDPDFADAVWEAADVQSVAHGKWEEVQEWMGDVEYSCSVCGCYAPWKELTTDQVCTEYCPHCGAKMDGET